VRHPLRSTSGRKTRADYGITAYVGANGGGKTCAMVWDTLPTLESGRPVLSTVRLLDYEDPRPCEDDQCHLVKGDPDGRLWATETCDKDDPDRHRQAHPLWVGFIGWPQLLAWQWGDVLLDEVSGVASSRTSHAMPDEVALHLQQMRKTDSIVRWSAPSWKRADTVIRECTALVVSCRGALTTRHRAVDGELERRWRQRRLFTWKAYDAYQFEDFTVGARERLKSIKTDLHWGPGSPAFDAYDTYQKALSLAASNVMTGRCMTCGGRRSAPVCKFPEGHPVELRPDRAAAAGAPLAGPRRGLPLADAVVPLAETAGGAA
jgi:hypothetical protein